MTKGEPKNIICEVLEVFDSFVVANLEQNSYAYYSHSGENAYPEASEKGIYTELVRTLYCGVCPREDETATLEEYLNPACIRRQLIPGTEQLQWEYEDRDEACKTLHVMCIQREDDIPVRLFLALKSGSVQTENSRFLEVNRGSLSILAETASDKGGWEMHQDCLRQKDYQGRRVLVAEDNALSREIIEDLLQITGADVETAVNGKDAVSRIGSVPDGYYDMILMDVQMPVMGGYDAARAIRFLDRRAAAHIPIVAMAVGAPEEESDIREAEMNDCLTKPICPCQLMEVLGKFWT